MISRVSNFSNPAFRGQYSFKVDNFEKLGEQEKFDDTMNCAGAQKEDVSRFKNLLGQIKTFVESKIPQKHDVDVTLNKSYIFTPFKEFNGANVEIKLKSWSQKLNDYLTTSVFYNDFKKLIATPTEELFEKITRASNNLKQKESATDSTGNNIENVVF